MTLRQRSTFRRAIIETLKLYYRYCKRTIEWNTTQMLVMHGRKGAFLAATVACLVTISRHVHNLVITVVLNHAALLVIQSKQEEHGRNTATSITLAICTGNHIVWLFLHNKHQSYIVFHTVCWPLYGNIMFQLFIIIQNRYQ